MIEAMATVENVAAGARAVFFSVAWADPQDGFAAQDAASVFAQLEGLFHASRAIADPRWLSAAAEDGAGDVELPAPKSAEEPAIRRIHMDWDHIEVATELPWEFIVGGGLVGLVTMTTGVAGTAPTIQVAISQLGDRAGRLGGAAHRRRARRHRARREGRPRPVAAAPGVRAHLPRRGGRVRGLDRVGGRAGGAYSAGGQRDRP